MPESVSNLSVVYIPAEDVQSRAARCADACGRLQAAKEAIDDELSRREEAAKEAGETFEDTDSLDDLSSELDSASSDADGVSFPGMY